MDAPYRLVVDARAMADFCGCELDTLSRLADRGRLPIAEETGHRQKRRRYFWDDRETIKRAVEDNRRTGDDHPVAKLHRRLAAVEDRLARLEEALS